MNEGFGRYILHTLEILAAASLACIAIALMLGVLAYRSAGRPQIVWTWLAIAFGFLAMGPPGFVLYAVNH